jgi:hypothetical protein
MCPEFYNAMHANDLRNAKWKKAARRLKARLDVDCRNHTMLVNPWARMAHCMVSGWRNIASQGRLGYVPPVRRLPTTWTEAAVKMKAQLCGRRQSRLLDTTTWRFWANHLSRMNTRYVRKSLRQNCAVP